MIPKGFIAEMKTQLGRDETEKLCHALRQDPTVAIRLNPHKPCSLPEDISGSPVEWYPQSIRLTRRPQFTLMPQLHAGGFYVQDPSSMIISHVVRQISSLLNEPLTMLDACAAPGGKTTAAADALPPGSLIVANEYDPRRAQILAENVTKWGYPDIIVTQGDTSQLSELRNTFDLLLIDAPCSGEGMMRKDPAARQQWSKGLVKQCAALQQEIIDNLWPTLRPGGYMIYSTCTFNLDEDEQQALRIIHEYDTESIPIHSPEEWGIAGSIIPQLHAMRFMPHITCGEGLFLTVLRKSGDRIPLTHASAGRKKQRQSHKAKIPVQLPTWINAAGEYEFIPSENNEWLAIRKEHLHTYHTLRGHTRLLQAGVTLATEKGRDLIPHHSLALSTLLNPEAFPHIALTLDEALNYLRREPLTLPPVSPQGHILATYAELPLGFMKNLGNRTNNLYPANWRIRSL